MIDGDPGVRLSPRMPLLAHRVHLGTSGGDVEMTGRESIASGFRTLRWGLGRLAGLGEAAQGTRGRGARHGDRARRTNVVVTSNVGSRGTTRIVYARQDTHVREK
jgi:hypothetical protein